MKKIAAVLVAGALTAGVAAVEQPADAYAVKPTVCQILGAGHNATTYVRGRTQTYPAQFFVKAPGGVPTGNIHIYYYQGTSKLAMSVRLVNGTVFERVHVNYGRLTIKFGYGGTSAFAPCAAHFTTNIVR